MAWTTDRDKALIDAAMAAERERCAQSKAAAGDRVFGLDDWETWLNRQAMAMTGLSGPEFELAVAEGRILGGAGATLAAVLPLLRNLRGDHETAVAAERERCAKIADDIEADRRERHGCSSALLDAHVNSYDRGGAAAAQSIAGMIRKGTPAQGPTSPQPVHEPIDLWRSPTSWRQAQDRLRACMQAMVAEGMKEPSAEGFSVAFNHMREEVHAILLEVESAGLERARRGQPET